MIYFFRVLLLKIVLISSYCAQENNLDDIRWILGTWENKSQATHTIEQWKKPA